MEIWTSAMPIVEERSRLADNERSDCRSGELPLRVEVKRRWIAKLIPNRGHGKPDPVLGSAGVPGRDGIGYVNCH